MSDVLIVGAGPAGAVAAALLARAGARVRLFDRAAFPRDKLCGDTINPGTLATLRRLAVADGIDANSLTVDGMRVTGEGGVSIQGRYPRGLTGRAILRRDLDLLLVEQAMRAGARFEPCSPVRSAIVEDGRVAGIALAQDRAAAARARVVIAADGRHSTLAFQLGLLRHPVRPRRWAIGAYFSNVDGLSSFGEMHIRRGRYIGIAPVPHGAANVCVVKPSGGGDRTLHDPLAAIRAALEADPLLRARFRGADACGDATLLGPLAAEAVPGASTPDGLLLAGDAAGFIDPMTGDGIGFAIRGAELAAAAALDALEHGWSGVQARYQTARRRAFRGKWRVNRALRALVASPAAVAAATRTAAAVPALVRILIARAGDCDLALNGT